LGFSLGLRLSSYSPIEGFPSPALEPDQPPLVIAALVVGVLQEAAISSGQIVAGIAGLIVLLLLSALYSGSEVALFSLDTTQKEELKEAEDAASKRVVRLLKNPRALLVSILIQNTIVNVGAAIIAAVMTHAVATQNNWSPVATVLIEIVVLTFVILVVSEITPKLIANRHPVQFARKLSGFLFVMHRILFPVSSFLARSMQAFHGRFERIADKISAEDLKTMAEIGEAHGTIEEEERALIHSIVDFGDTSVREIMISRLDMIALSVSATVADAVDIIKSQGHSRLPLYVEHLDNILGVVYAKDLLRHLTEFPDETQLDWTRLARPPMFVPVGKMLDDLLKDFQEKRTHIAIVVDEYGGTAGLVTLEDVLEEIVGEIRDEHDEEEVELIEKLSENEFLVDAKIDLDDMFDSLDMEVETGEFDFETLGGFMYHLAREIPKEGDSFDFENVNYQVANVDGHRILHVKVTKPSTGLEAERYPDAAD
jgi:putative hemolysin